MRAKSSILCRPALPARGFSLTELVVTLAVGLVLIAVGLPAFLRAYHSYELSSAAVQVADILRLARYEAIRLNKQVPCQIAPSSSNPGMTDVWVDSNGNGLLDTGEKMILLGSSGNLVDGGTVPNTSTLITSAVGSVSTTAPSPTSSTITFDARGALNPPTSVNVFYLASSLAPEAGFRSVLLMPAGSIQIWTSDNSGNWQQQR
jgi:prepilin-type N-terminal cleavage/methylation domain-containing protein